MQKLKIRQATGQGYIEVPEWGCFDGSYPSSGTRRGRVQGGGILCPALCTSSEIYVYEGIYETDGDTDKGAQRN
jgi:hypothetical protein